MDRMIYTAMTGATAASHRQQLLANNLANVSTPGFRAELATFRSVPVRGDGATTRVFNLEATAGHDAAPGAINPTGRPLDVAARDGAWFTVQSLNGTEAYTRAGAFQVNADGTLVNPQGLPVLGEGETPIVVPNNATINIGDDGNISAKVGDLPAQPLGRLKLVTPTEDNPLQRGEDGLFRTAQQAPLLADPNARVQSGALEGSNVNPIEAMVGMIAVARQFEIQMRMMQNGEANDKAASQLLSHN
ncbi:flagellar basal-body rod protein FlgF [Hydrogenophaga sp. 5NK40-0174]|uniref:flagellar basal-body rod protein FlgF n=1 Tax=Hydrogenophaga sp. 5NK40-0174 TaxID=3127649 RepID=UPI0031027750